MKTIKLRERLSELVPKWRDDARAVSKGLGDAKFDEIKVSQVFGGMRGIKCLVCETSYLDPNEGIRWRGYTIPEVRAKLPRPSEKDEVYPSGLWHLLLTGEVPDEAAVLELEDEFRRRADVPEYVINTINALPKEMHPMAQITLAVLALQKDSEFARNYAEGMKKEDYWVHTFEDSLTLLARMPVIAAYIYRRSYKDGKMIPPDPKLDWGANFAHMMGVDNPEYYNLMRLYLLLHSDHESGNVSAHTGFLVGSALSDMYYSVSAALGGLAGPLHGLANQECLKWI
ncbi:MAG: citrate (Si)-synthase, partial [Thermoplasmata archaeon]|nr:citrate (Si)-synthase [Thermoplasmata archaeon]